MIVKLKEPAKAENLFEGWEETIIWSCLQGIMGEIWADDAERPTAAMARLSDFSFFTGAPNNELIEYAAEHSQILTPRDEAWALRIEQQLGERVKPEVRYAILKEKDVFDEERLKQYTENLPNGYELKIIDQSLYDACLQEEWSADLVKQFGSYEQFAHYALGVVAVYEGRIVSGASSYSAYKQGIEIEIDTEESHRRRGLAVACGAKLILLCLQRGLYPSWDAANLASVALAEKLGYHRGQPYMVYEVISD